MSQMLVGAIVTASFVAGLFFFRYWRSTRDRFFLYFALSFWIEAADRAAFGLTGGPTTEFEPLFYGVRVLAYGLIVLAILQKNRKRP